MNLYKISQTENDDYDTFDSAVVAAKTSTIARNMDLGNCGRPMVWDKKIPSCVWCSSADKVIVEYLGKAKIGTKEGIICSSFNAG